MGNVQPSSGLPVSLRNRNNVVLDNATDVTVCTYNILACCYVSPSTYPQCAREHIAHPYRHNKLMELLPPLGVDVFCFQEVETPYFHDTLQPAMAQLGYAGAFLKKSNASREGVATFWREKACRLLGRTDVALNDLAHPLCQAAGIDPYRSRLYQDTVALVTRLEVQTSKGAQELYVTNVHVYWNWKEPDVQSLQCATLLTKLHQLAPSAPHIVSGDFNIQPTAPGYPVLATGAPDLQRDLAILQACPPVSSGSNKTGDLKFAPLVARLPPQAFTHPLAVQSAYKSVCGAEPEYTNLTDNFEGCLDYLWYTRGLKANAALALAPADDIRSYGGAPNADFPSDHLPLRAAFVFE